MTSSQSASVDPEQVAFYTQLADRWWDEQGPFWPLHLLNALRREWIIDRIASAPDSAQPLQGLRILDIGCGGGLLSEAMARAGAAVTGIDVTERNIRVAHTHAEKAGLAIDYRHSSAEALAADGQHYDVVLNMEVVEHVADFDGFMAAACALVKPGGSMFVATLNRSLAGFVIGIVGAEYVTGLLPRGTHQWSRFVRPTELAEQLQRGGLAVVERTGVRVNPWRRRMALTAWLGVNYMVYARRGGS
ncbi:MAG: bifunctional 2-polyprenyl-6-hydroxyphenol methylase/3-demethylubiquinol 3-O-methyltransferase UbiG [Gammaproteobacteria bacterium]|nr:bifunctional 2-polyprenyl-6-hydroxyphenol methylase/3-demethylubiquinol 3-O-methyltransferase UbiG [Gammaproteobacteria bacterium]